MATPTIPPEEYDFVVLGSGEAGKYLAWTMARKGLRTAVVERKYVGGSCGTSRVGIDGLEVTCRSSP